MNKKQERREELHSESVHLGPLFSIRPTVYVPIIWGIIAATLFFFLFVFPGIRHYGSKVSITSLPQKAAVYLNDRYVGVTPWQGFVEAGMVSIRVEKHGFLPAVVQEKIKGQFFFTLIFRRLNKIAVKLSADSPDVLVDHALWGFARNSGIQNNTLFRYEPVLRDAAHDLMVMDAPGKIDDLLRMSLPHLVSSEQWYDFLSGMHVLSVSQRQSPVTVIAETLFRWNAQYPALLVFARSQLPSLSLLSENLSDILAEGEKEYRAVMQRTMSVKISERRSNERIAVEGIFFRRLKGGNFAVGYPFSNQSSLPYMVTLPAYYVMEHELRKEDYLRFLADNPEWAASETSRLQEEGLVTEQYLYNIDEIAEDAPLPYLSWHSAVAYAEWLNTRIPASKKLKASLPSEAEWEYAAMLYQDDLTAEGNASNFIGGLWEWTRPWYVSHPALAEADGGSAGYEKTVRGGSNYTQDPDYRSRGGQPSEWCTPYLGFRLVLLEVDNERDSTE